MCVKALSCSDKLVIVAGWGFLCSNRAINLCLLLGIPSPTILYFIVHEGIGFFHHTTLPSSTNALPKKPKPTSFKDLLNSKTSTKPHKSQTKWSPFNFNNWYFVPNLPNIVIWPPCECYNLLSVVQYHPVRFNNISSFCGINLQKSSEPL